MGSNSYRGWKSTKLGLAMIAMALITFCYGMTGYDPNLFSTYCMTMLGAAGIYSGSQITEKIKAKVVPPEPPKDK